MLSDSQENECMFTCDFTQEKRSISTKQTAQTTTNYTAPVSASAINQGP